MLVKFFRYKVNSLFENNLLRERIILKNYLYLHNYNF